MKISRGQLITLINVELASLATRRERSDESTRESYRRAAETYVGSYAEEWYEFAQTIRERIAQRLPITKAEIPTRLREYGDRLNLFGQSVPTPMRPFEREDELRSLLKMLETVVDDEISTHALEKMGFRMGRLLK